MHYRDFGRLGWKPSALGFGVMRLPFHNGDPAQIDEPEAIRMIRRAIDLGVNYVDTAYPYHGGKSEGLVAKALAGGYRKRVKVATKSPVWLLEKPEDAERYFTEQLQRLEMDYVDLYLLHSLDARGWSKVRELKVLDWAEKAKADGRIRHLGFSFHDRVETLKTIIDDFSGWEFCQIQYNYMDVDFQAGLEGLRYAAGKGLGVVVMEPLRGGALASPPAPVRRLWEELTPRRSPAEWALDWLWNQPEVSVVLSGMSTMAQVEENTASAGRSGVGSLTAEESAVFDRARELTLKSGWIPCTGCNYCSPCPNKVGIADAFAVYNVAVVPGDLDRGRRWYSKLPAENRPGACQACRECEKKCPQDLPISELLAKVHAALKEDEPATPAPPTEGEAGK